MKIKPIPNYSGYFATSDGDIIGLRGQVMGCTVNPHGYLVSKAKRDDGHWIGFSAHRFVASAFHPNPENKPEVNHIDGNKSNNRPDNLEWCTRLENMRHCQNVLGFKIWQHSTNKAKGERHHWSVLTDDLVRQIRVMRASGATQVKIAEATGVNRSTLRAVLDGLTWKHVD